MLKLKVMQERGREIMSLSVGKKIRNRRLTLKMTQQELARKLDVSSQVVSNWEREYTSPDTNDVIKLSKILLVSISYLIDDEIDEMELPYERMIEIHDRMVSEEIKNKNEFDTRLYKHIAENGGELLRQILFHSYIDLDYLLDMSKINIKVKNKQLSEDEKRSLYNFLKLL